MLLSPIQRVFIYLVLEHAENLAVQDLAVAHFTALRDIAAEHEQALFRDFLDYAERHREVISRFGRFPHRNAILGRDSSDAEQSFLQQPGSSFPAPPPPSLAGAAEPCSAALNLKRSKELDMSLRTPLLIACTVLLAACSPITQENFASSSPAWNGGSGEALGQAFGMRRCAGHVQLYLG